MNWLCETVTCPIKTSSFTTPEEIRLFSTFMVVIACDEDWGMSSSLVANIRKSDCWKVVKELNLITSL